MPWDIIVYILYYFTREADQQIWNYSVQLIMNCTMHGYHNHDGYRMVTQY